MTSAGVVSFGRGASVAIVVLTSALAHAAPADEGADESSAEGASAEEAPSSSEDVEASNRAREAFVEGTALAREAQWSQALAAFERARAIKPHAVTTYNIGTCHRAIGAYAQAYLTFERALAEHAAPDGGALPDALVRQSEAFLVEIEALLVTVDLEVVPTGAILAVDGRPLHVASEVHWAGVRAPGTGEPVVEPRLRIRLDPGAHVFTFSRAGFETAIVNQSFPPGARRSLRVELDTLPGRLRVDATVPEALVSLDGREVGPTPIDVFRPAGSYDLLVEKEGYASHRAVVDLAPGQEVAVRAPLVAETTSVFETWWFWTAAGVVVAGGVTATYFLTRPEPEPPPYDGGSIDWVVTPERATFRF
jgi:hypothetical protein